MRILGGGRQPIEVVLHDLDLTTGRLEELGTFGPLDRWPGQWMATDSTGTRLLTAEQSAVWLRSLDDVSTAGNRELVALPPDGHARGGFLADGRVIVASYGAGPATLHVFDRGGEAGRSVELPPGAERLILGGEVAPGRILLSAGRHRSNSILYVLDVDSGTATAIGRDLRPVVWLHDNTWGRPTFRGAPGDPATRLVQGLAMLGTLLVQIDPMTGAQEVVLGP